MMSRNLTAFISVVVLAIAYSEISRREVRQSGKHKEESETRKFTNESSKDRENTWAPFSDKLKVDNDLKLSCSNFQLEIERSLSNQTNAYLTIVGNLNDVTPFPTPGDLSKFATSVYTDYNEAESEEEYGDRLELPIGWKLLTTADHRNVWYSPNGYFGAAYWHPLRHHVVIAHRGSSLINLGSLYTDFKGIFGNQYVAQMDSASTFTAIVVSVLATVEEERGIKFELFFTGHSLGGWLAQITTFTARYLQVIGSYFHKNTDNYEGFVHAHAVAFDPPGCKDMLLNMVDVFDVRYAGRSIHLESLDITSYLSAPNQINTCNNHVGTVYRIFIDLSKMSLLDKTTLQYTLFTHSMDRILKVFDPLTGQVRKENGLLKIHKVKDWPVRNGLSGGEELNKFFEWAEHFNDYHPDPKDVSFEETQRRSPIRYQTSRFDPLTVSLNVFTRSEKDFLRTYQKWREMDLSDHYDFCTNETTEDVKKKMRFKLKNFVIENDCFRCTSEEELHSLIPFVKSLFHICNIKKSTIGIVAAKKFYQTLTTRYLQDIEMEPLDFNGNLPDLDAFLASSDKRIWKLKTKEKAWIGLKQIIRGFQKNNVHLKDFQYTAVKLKRFVESDPLIKFEFVLDSQQHLLMIDCEIKNLELSDIKRLSENLHSALEKTPNLKIILVADKHFLDWFKKYFPPQLNKNTIWETETDNLNWEDITEKSKHDLFERKEIEFQGIKIRLSEVINDYDERLLESISPSIFAENTRMKIGGKVTANNKFDATADLYIPRAFRRGTTVMSEEELIKDHLEKVVIITGVPGMGKTTLLDNVTRYIKKTSPDVWVLRLQLKDLTKQFKKKNPSFFKSQSIDTVTDFLCRDILQLQSQFEKEIFRYAVHKSGKISIFLDGFDEIGSDYSNRVIALVQRLRETAIDRIWVTTRLHMKETLENKLELHSYLLEGFSECMQIAFLAKTWKFGLTLSLAEKKRLLEYAEVLLNRIKYFQKDKKLTLTEIPLQTKMLAEVYGELAKQFCRNQYAATIQPECFRPDCNGQLMPNGVSLLELYEKFIDKKFDIYAKEKLDMGNEKQARIFEREKKRLTRYHGIVAMKVLFPEVNLRKIFLQTSDTEYDTEEVALVGILVNNGKEFIHGIFGEYFAASFLVSQMFRHRKPQSKYECKFLLTQVLGNNQFEILRVFINSLLERHPIPVDTIGEHRKFIAQLWSEGRLKPQGHTTPLQVAYTEDLFFVADFLTKSINNNFEIWKEMMFYKSTIDWSFMRSSLTHGNNQAIEKLIKYLTDNFNTETLRTFRSGTYNTDTNIIHYLSKRIEERNSVQRATEGIHFRPAAIKISAGLTTKIVREDLIGKIIEIFDGNLIDGNIQVLIREILLHIIREIFLVSLIVENEYFLQKFCIPLI